MKPSQTVLLLFAVVAVIFGVTFASMYVSRPKTDGPEPKKPGERSGPILHLTFDKQHHPHDLEDMDLRETTEYGRTGRHDFWFRNNNAEPVRMGLDEKTCVCSDVQVCIVEEDWQRPLARATAALIGSAADRLSLSLSGIALANDRVNERDKLAANARNLATLKKKDQGVDVPAGASGFVRLTWTAKRGVDPGPRRETPNAQLWWQNPRSGGATKLEVGAIVTEGLRLEATSIDFGRLGAGDSAARTLVVWSSSRADLGEPAFTTSAAPFLVCDKPERLTAAERRALSERLGADWTGPVKAAYRTTIRFREQVDGKRFDEGAFEESVKIVPKENILMPETPEVLTTGRVRGDVTLVGAESAMMMGRFSAKRPVRRSIVLQTERPNLELTVAKTPEFMKVSLSDPVAEGGLRKWTLTVVIEADQVSGQFPRRDTPLYRDTTIRLGLKGAASGGLRIRVEGEATQ